ncbi:hypothetical protein [Ferviditalea candida]|uniref:Uncharacterized protein n=1 Tax=Ferviditalea candida TaxID=3108399 RepID=A0ABU5ZHK2_9BACL|nr:hypothetical protein [Paenibacillaceae bacterium T2]
MVKKSRAKSIFSSIMIATMLIVSVPFNAKAEQAAAVLEPVNYRLTDTLTVQVKSILNEAGYNGTRIGAVVELYNNGTRSIRTPDYALEMRTASGAEYVLQPSSANAGFIQPKEQVELSYMLTVKRKDDISLSTLSWVKFNKSVYPKQAIPVLTLPIASLQSPKVTKMWGEPFTIPVLSSALEFTPAYLFVQNTSEGPATMVVLQVQNKSSKKQWLPDFTIDGKSNQTTYKGQRTEQGPIMLEPGEKKYIHYAIRTDDAVTLWSLSVRTPESFAADSQTSINYTVARINIQIPVDPRILDITNRPIPYGWNKPIRFNALNRLVPSMVNVSLEGLNLYQGDGFKVVVASFKLQNQSGQPVAVPDFQAELKSGHDDSSYIGIRQSFEEKILIPHINYAVEYYFIVPDQETGDELTMKLLDGKTASPFYIPIAAFQTQVGDQTDDGSLSFYPFNVNINSGGILTYYNSSQGPDQMPWINKLILNLDIRHRDVVVPNQGLSKMEVELTDKTGGIIGSQSFSFTGTDRLSSGSRTIIMKSDASPASSFVVHIYETIDTMFGEAKRLVKTMQY